MSHFQKFTATGKLAKTTAKTHAAVIDQRNHLMWTAKDIGTAAFGAAPALVEDLNRKAFAGFTDWRLPTIEELLTLVDRTRHHPAINTDAFPSCKGGWYWSSTVDAESPSDCAWFVYFSYGLCFLDNQDSQGRVRAVRSVSPSASSQ
jgi:hypothetical protein